jgi:hypothetical protein
MTEHMNCQWIENNLEALLCDRLDPEHAQQARAHIENCAACRSELQAFNAIDPLIKRHFQSELRRANQPRVVRGGRIFGLSAATLSLVAALLFVAFRTPQSTPAPPAVHVSVPSPSIAEVQPPLPQDKNPDAGAVVVERAKPAVEPAKPADKTPDAQAARSQNAPEFQVIDAAGYSRKLEDFRDHIVVIGVWSGASAEAVANLERLYKAYGSNARFRFLGISNKKLAKPANATFPVFYNQGSKLLGVQPGEFAVLDEKGEILLRGSLVKDFDELLRTLQKDTK